MPTRIFISYARRDETFARKLAASLDSVDVDVWIDVDDIPAGMKWSTAIQQGLQLCDAMIVIISPQSMVSSNVEDEWQYYLDQGKPVVPVLWRPTEVHFQLNRLQYVDFYGESYEEGLKQLYGELLRMGAQLNLPEGFVVPDERPATPDRPQTLSSVKPIPKKPPKRTRTPLIVGIVIVLIILGVGAALILPGILNSDDTSLTAINRTNTAEAVVEASDTPEASNTPEATDAPDVTDTLEVDETAVAVASATALAEIPRVIPNSGAATVRAGNLLGSTRLGTLSRGMAASVLGRNDDNGTWWYIELDINGVTRRGWVSDSVVQELGDFSNVLQVDPDTAPTFPPTPENE